MSYNPKCPARGSSRSPPSPGLHHFHTAPRRLTIPIGYIYTRMHALGVIWPMRDRVWYIIYVCSAEKLVEKRVSYVSRSSKSFRLRDVVVDAAVAIFCYG